MLCLHISLVQLNIDFFSSARLRLKLRKKNRPKKTAVNAAFLCFTVNESYMKEL